MSSREPTKRRRFATPLRIFAGTLCLVGVLLVAEALVTVYWKEPLTAISAGREQNALARQLSRVELRVVPRRERQKVRRLPTERARLRELARSLRRKTARGEPLGRISIPKLGSDFVFVQGADLPSLKKGPGHYVFTALPGEGRTVGIPGHRTTYLAPFRHIDRLVRGDRIVLRMPYGRFTYRVTGSKIVEPDAVEVLRSVGHERVVLTACHPPFSLAERIIVFATLAKTKARPV